MTSVLPVYIFCMVWISSQSRVLLENENGDDDVVSLRASSSSPASSDSLLCLLQLILPIGLIGLTNTFLSLINFIFQNLLSKSSSSQIGRVKALSPFQRTSIKKYCNCANCSCFNRCFRCPMFCGCSYNPITCGCSIFPKMKCGPDLFLGLSHTLAKAPTLLAPITGGRPCNQICRIPGFAAGIRFPVLVSHGETPGIIHSHRCSSCLVDNNFPGCLLKLVPLFVLGNSFPGFVPDAGPPQIYHSHLVPVCIPYIPNCSANPTSPRCPVCPFNIMMNVVPGLSKPMKAPGSDKNVQSFVSLVNSHGYSAQEYSIITEDGYILTVYRLPPIECHEKKGPVLLQHGLLGSSYDWVIPGRKKALAYLLSAQGYDVWLANSRGNSISRRHVKRKIESAEFWDFSLDEMGIYDIPATIRYILTQTGAPNLHFIGWGTGATIFHIFASSHVDLATKTVKFFTSLAPIIQPLHSRPCRWKQIADSEYLINLFLKDTIYRKEMLNNNDWFYAPSSYLCSSKSCRNVMLYLYGSDTDDLEKLPDIIKYVPAGTSRSAFIHLLQIIRHGCLQNFYSGALPDFMNKECCCKKTYNLTHIRVPAQMFISDGDSLSSEADANEVAKKMPFHGSIHRITDKYFSQAHFLFSMKAKEMVYFPLIESMKAYW